MAVRRASASAVNPYFSALRVTMQSLAAQLVMIAWALIVVYPFFWMIFTSFKTDQQILFEPGTLPNVLHWENFGRAWQAAHIGDYFANSVVVVSASLIGTLVCAVPASYVLARFAFPGNRILYLLFVSGLMFPVYLLLVPLFFVVDGLGLLNTYQGLVLVYVAYSLPFTVFFLVPFFKSIPNELSEAAIVDGASHFLVFRKIMLPLAGPAILSIALFNFIGHWNQFILPLVLIQDPDRQVLSQGLAALAIKQYYANDFSGLFAALTIVTLPTLIAYGIFRNRIQAALTAGSGQG